MLRENHGTTPLSEVQILSLEIKYMKVGTFQPLSPVGNKFHFVLIFPSNSASFVLGVLERTGRKRNSEDSSCRPRVFRVHPERPFQARYSGYDGAVWIDCQIFICHW